MKKYYWFVWCYLNASNIRAYTEEVIRDQHPFKIVGIRKQNAPPAVNITLINWKEITKEEYELHLES